jgi:hypothetical protein
MAPEDNPADEVQPTKEEWDEYERERAEIQPGRVFNVRAWWGTAKDQTIPCRIHSFLGTDDVLVLPLAGNPHSRYVRRANIIDRIGGHPAELA